MKIRTFNTGRMYSDYGQRIAYAPLLRIAGAGQLVAFYDVDRMIYAVVEVRRTVLTDAEMEAAVLAQYDACAYLHNYVMTDAIEDALKEAARIHAPVAP